MEISASPAHPGNESLGVVLLAFPMFLLLVALAFLAQRTAAAMLSLSQSKSKTYFRTERDTACCVSRQC